MADEKQTEKPAFALGGTAIKPVGWDRSGMEAFKYMLWNPDTGEVLTRTPLSWVKIIVFYIIYYSCLAAFWIACLQVFFLTIPEQEPRWLLSESIIGVNPGVGLRPKQTDKLIDSSIFIFDQSDVETAPTDDDGEGNRNADAVKRMENFMAKNSNTTNLVTPVFDTATLESCAESPYGYMPVNGKVEPCLFLKLNKIYGWKPYGVNLADLDSPTYADMTDELKTKIRETEGTTGNATNVYMDCKGRYDADREALTLTYFPENQGLPMKYFPFAGGNYQSPLVAVKISSTSIGQLLHIECRAWFHDVKHVTKDKEGLIQFEVQIKDSSAVPKGE